MVSRDGSPVKMLEMKQEKIAETPLMKQYFKVKAEHPDLSEVERCGAKLIKDASRYSYVKITIKDTGMGLAESELEGIFEPYTQLDKAHKKTILRSITLGTAYTMLKRMGGAVWINSEVMKGSSFFVILPVEKELETK